MTKDKMRGGSSEMNREIIEERDGWLKQRKELSQAMRKGNGLQLDDTSNIEGNGISEDRWKMDRLTFRGERHSGFARATRNIRKKDLKMRTEIWMGTSS
jgi:hypothetical protein